LLNIVPGAIRSANEEPVGLENQQLFKIYAPPPPASLPILADSFSRAGAAQHGKRHAAPTISR
jgi:hypothetical protein